VPEFLHAAVARASISRMIDVDQTVISLIQAPAQIADAFGRVMM
jgi:hypothetical protein